MHSVINISALNAKNLRGIDRSIKWFLESFKKTEKEKMSNLVQKEFHDLRSKILVAKIFKKPIGSICVSPFDVVGFFENSEKQKLIEFFEEKGINPQKVAHIGGLGFNLRNSKIDLIWWSKFLIFAAIKTAKDQGWGYVVGQTKSDGVMAKIAIQFRYRRINITLPNKSWFLKNLT